MLHQRDNAVDDASDDPSTPPPAPLALWRALRQTLAWFRPYPLRTAVVVAGVVVEMGLVACAPLATQALIDRVLIPHDARPLALIGAALACGAIVVTAAGLACDHLYAGMAADIMNGLRLRMYEHMQRLSPTWFARRSAGDVTARFSTDLASVQTALEFLVSWGLQPALDVVVALVLLFVLDWRLALAAQLVWPIALLAPRVLEPRISAAAQGLKSEEASVLDDVQALAGGHAVMRAFGLEDTLRGRFRDRLRRLRAVGVRARLFTVISDRSVGGGLLALQGVLLAGGGYLVLHRQWTIGGLVAFQTIFASLGYSICYVARFFSYHVHAAAGLDRIDHLLREPCGVSDAPDALAMPELRDRVTLDRVSFAYAPGRLALDDVTFTIRRGERVALVGPSGSGKSTLLGLLLRLYDPTGGALSLDGREVRSATRRSIVRQVGVVFQDTFLFNASIAENIRVGLPSATDAQVIAAAKSAELHDFIAALPQGYDTPVGERGAGLSGGQRQRVAIARALLREPSILLLDEATSALDAITEAAVQATLTRVGAERTVITATHRLAAVTDADRIVVLDAGRVVEQGRHEELVARGGAYARLWALQTGA